MNRFKILVATPVYNGEDTIDRLSNSISSYPNITWLVRDDGSTDETAEKLHKIKSSKPNNLDLVVYSGENKGLTYGRNFLCDKFITRFTEFTHMIFIDADDELNPGWLSTIEYWLCKVSNLYPDEKSPYLGFQYWNESKSVVECPFYTRLNTHRKDLQYQCQYYGGGVDFLHVIPREYLTEVKEYDGNYYHVVKDEKWSPCMHNFMAYTDYPVSYIGSIVATIHGSDDNMSSSYYNNIVTKYGRSHLDEMIMFYDKYCNNGADWTRVSNVRWRWMFNSLIRMIKNGTLVRSFKDWDGYKTPDDVTPSKEVE